MKALKDDCERFEVFPPGHIYSSKAGMLSPLFQGLIFLGVAIKIYTLVFIDSVLDVMIMVIINCQLQHMGHIDIDAWSLILWDCELQEDFVDTIIQSGTRNRTFLQHLTSLLFSGLPSKRYSCADKTVLLLS